MVEREIFTAALNKQDPVERAAFLDRACAGDAAVRGRVESLLAEHEKLGSFMDVSAPAPTADRPVREAAGEQIDGYKLLEQIGEGGFGVVYMAEQTTPVRRKVALKILKPGMDTRQVVARFEAERQALALMDHPNIARVFDGGVVGQASSLSSTPRQAGSLPHGLGRPYFVMELVKGVPITEFCDQNQLTPRQRLELFVPVCQAIQHAHQKGIIHRDLKPSNVLVSRHDTTPVVKVIDFGVAKALGQELTDKTLFTGIAQMIGTPLYMSPEQAGMSDLDVDTRSDIYSLGVLLYELLTGTTPFTKERFQQAAFDEIRRIIREEEPQKPSTRLSELSSDHAPRDESGHVTRSVTATLPSIAAQRQMEPAKLTKLMRGELDWIVMKALEKDRNRRYETATGFALDVQRYLADEPVQACPPSAAYRLRKFARRNRAALLTSAMVVSAVLFGVGVLGWAVRDREARQEELAKQEAVRQAKLEETVNRALEQAEDCYQRDKLPEAMGALERAEELLASGGGSDQLQQRVRQWRKDLDMVARLEEIRLEETSIDSEPGDQPSPAYQVYLAAFHDYGVDLNDVNSAPEVERIARVVEQIRRSAIRDRLVEGLDDWPAETLMRGQELLAVLRQVDPDPWRSQFREAVKRYDRKACEELGRNPELLAQPPATLRLAGIALLRFGHHRQAFEVLRQAQRRSPDDFTINFLLARWLEAAKSADDVVFYRVALALRPDNVKLHRMLGEALRKHGNLAEAEAMFREALRLRPDDVTVHHDLGPVLLGQLKLPEAEAVYREFIRLAENLPDARLGLATTLSFQGKQAEAEAEYRAAVQRWPTYFKTHSGLALFLEEQGKLPEAETQRREAVRLWPQDGGVHLELGKNLQRQRKLDEAEIEFQEAARLDPKNKAPQESLDLNRALRRQNEAVAEAREAVRLNPSDAIARRKLGNFLLNAGNLDEAEVELLEVVRLRPTDGAAHFVLGEVHACKAQWDKAAGALARSLELYPQNSYVWYQCALARLQLGDLKAYQSACREMLERFGQTNQFQLPERIATTCLLGPEGMVDAEKIQKLVEQTLAGDESERNRALLLKALLDYRSGRHAEAADGLNRLRYEHPNRYCVLSMAQQRLGKTEEARTTLTKARARTMYQVSSAKPVLSVHNVFDSLSTQILYREAESLLTTVESPQAKSE